MNQAIHLLEPSLLKPDKYFKVYKVESSLLFVKIGGQFYDEKSDDEAPLVLGLILMLARKLFLNKLKSKRETEIDHQVKANPQDFRNKKQNFEIPSRVIKKVELKAKATKHTSGNDSGTIRLMMEDGTEQKYTIPSFVTRETIIDFFESQLILVEIV